MNRTTSIGRELPVVWLEGGEPIQAQIQQLRQKLSASHPFSRDGKSHLIRLALNEAEALAWQTEYPHLVFPALAEEKIAAIQQWHSRQNLLWHDSFELAFAA